VRHAIRESARPDVSHFFLLAVACIGHASRRARARFQPLRPLSAPATASALGWPHSPSRKPMFPRPNVLVSGRRYYNPSKGRFLGRDPKGEPGGLNLYGFTSNNPVSRWDVLGMNSPVQLPKFVVREKPLPPDYGTYYADFDWQYQIYLQDLQRWEEEMAEAEAGEEKRKTCLGIQDGLTALSQKYADVSKHLAFREDLFNKFTSQMSAWSANSELNARDELIEVIFGLFSLSPLPKVAVSGGEFFVTMNDKGDEKGWDPFWSMMKATVGFGLEVGLALGAVSVDVSKFANPIVTGTAATAFAVRLTAPFALTAIEQSQQIARWQAELDRLRSTTRDEQAGIATAIGLMRDSYSDNDCENIINN